ncbi:hypothetical protein D3C75_830090 [compost metagenome]
MDLRKLRVENLADLLAGLRLACGVSDPAGKIPDNQLHPVAAFLELAELMQHHRMAHMNIRCGRVHAQFNV